MPTPRNLNSIEIGVEGGYFPRAKALRPGRWQNTIRRGNNVWVRPGGVLEPARGLLEVSSTNVGARLFAANIERASIAGGLVGSRLPYAGLIRLDNAVLLFLSENTGAQVYLNEAAASGVITAATAGRLRVSVPNGAGGYNTFDAGFDKPTLTSGQVSVVQSAAIPRPMSGSIGVAVAPWRSKTNAIGPPSDVFFNDISPTNSTNIRINLPSAISGQDGWVYCGTRWGDQRGPIRVVRYIYTQPRGTFTATNGSQLLTAGVGTSFFRDLREGDLVTIDGGAYTIFAVTSDTTAQLTANFTGTTNPGKVMVITDAAANWYDWELGSIVSRDVLRPPRAAGVLKYAGRVLLWGIPDTTQIASTNPTGNALAALLSNNPEHVGLLYVVTDSGSDLVNVLGGDGPLYLMTTTSLEVVNFTNDDKEPYTIKIIAEPGFKAGTNGILHEDYFYGFNGTPFRTQAKKNIDVEFAQAVVSDMRNWDATRVMLAVDPIPDDSAVLYMYDDGNTTTVRPWMAHQGVWGPPLNLSARILDTQVVNGTLYVTYLSGGNTRTNAWEGGAGIGGTPYGSTQYYDGNLLDRNILKRIQVTGKVGTVRVYVAKPDEPVPDVSNPSAAEDFFLLSDIADQSEPEIGTHMQGRAYSFRFEFPSADGNFQSAIARGIPRGELR